MVGLLSQMQGGVGLLGQQRPGVGLLQQTAMNQPAEYKPEYITPELFEEIMRGLPPGTPPEAVIKVMSDKYGIPPEDIARRIAPQQAAPPANGLLMPPTDTHSRQNFPEGDYGAPQMAAPSPGLQQPTPDQAMEQQQPIDLAPIDVSSGGQEYTVKRGDNLWNLSKQHYGNATFWKQIAEANGITDPTKLKVGMTLIIPDTAALGQMGMAPTDDGSSGTPVPRPNPLRQPPMA